MSTPDPHEIADRLTRGRLRSYLDASDGDLAAALELYDWNTRVSGAFYEDIGRFEVVFRNALDRGLVELAHQRGWSYPWYRRRQLFPGRHGSKAMDEIANARRRATRRNVAETHGKVIAELNFGFWRFLCSKAYLTSLWVPALAAEFPGSSSSSDPRVLREQVEDRVQRIHFLRNRIAHHEPVHRRALDVDFDDLVEVLSWISSDAAQWVRSESRIPEVLSSRP